MSERGDALRELIEKAPLRAALRAVILYNSDMITNEFRLKVLREEIRRIEEEMSDEGEGVDKAVRRQLRWSEGLRNKVKESELPGPVGEEDAS